MFRQFFQEYRENGKNREGWKKLAQTRYAVVRTVFRILCSVRLGLRATDPDSGPELLVLVARYDSDARTRRVMLRHSFDSPSSVAVRRQVNSRPNPGRQSAY